MRHASEITLAKHPELMDALRDIKGITERSPGVFYRKSKAFLHFHEDPSGLYADLRTDVDEGFVRLRVQSRAQQSTLLKTVRTVSAPGYK